VLHKLKVHPVNFTCQKAKGRKMKKLFLVCILVSLLSSLLYASGRYRGKMVYSYNTPISTIAVTNTTAFVWELVGWSYDFQPAVLDTVLVTRAWTQYATTNTLGTNYISGVSHTVTNVLFGQVITATDSSRYRSTTTYGSEDAVDMHFYILPNEVLTLFHKNAQTAIKQTYTFEILEE